MGWKGEEGQRKEGMKGGMTRQEGVKREGRELSEMGEGEIEREIRTYIYIYTYIYAHIHIGRGRQTEDRRERR